MGAVNDPTGIRTAGLITEYSLYLTTLPLISSAMGLTSSMFALEGTAANMYLLYLASKFQKEHSNANARKVFMCSLWYLPFILSAFVFHSRNWEKEELEKEGNLQISNAVASAKESLKGMCIHEVLASKAAVKGEEPLCLKLATEKTADAALSTVGTLLDPSKTLVPKAVSDSSRHA